MDALIIIVAAFILCIRNGKESADEIEISMIKQEAPLETKLNPDFYDDPNAFMRIANELGFH